MSQQEDPLHRRLDVYLKTLGCTFVGVSDEKEVFVTFDHGVYKLDSVIENTKQAIKKQFGDEISTVVSVFAVNVDEVNQMVDQLNQKLAEYEEKPQLLDIGKF
jgi:hypothetical protein